MAKGGPTHSTIYTVYSTAAWIAQLVERQTAGGRGFKPQTGPTLRVLK